MSFTYLFTDKEFRTKENIFFIGIDVQEINTYILEKNNPSGVVEILLQEQIHDDEAFKREVLNLSKYFSAPIIGMDKDLRKFNNPYFGRKQEF